MGFWGTLGTIAGDVGGAFIGDPLLGNQIAGVVNAARGQLSSPLTPTQQQAITPLQEAQKTGLTTGENLLGLGTSTLQQPMNYWQSILSGSRGAITSAMAPELFQIGQGYNQAARTSAALNPRGGPSASFLSQLPFQQQRDVSTLFQTARPQAAGQLANSANALLGHGTSTLQASTAAGQAILGAAAQQALLSHQNQVSQGQGLFDLLTKYGPEILGKIFGGGGGGTGTGGGVDTGAWPTGGIG